MVEIVSEKCGITARDLYNQPAFSTVFKNFIDWIKTCVTEAQQSGIVYYPGIHMFHALEWLYLLYSSGSTQWIFF